MQIKGLFSCIITPFTQSRELDKEGLRENIRYQIKQGVDAIVALGTTGEAPTLTHHEREEVIAISQEECKGKVHLMVGTGSYSTAQTIENTRHAQRMGADSALIVCPYYNKPTPNGLYSHFKEVAEAAPNLPILIYNHLGRTGQNMPTSTLLRLAEIPNIAGVKEASGNINQIMEVIEHISLRYPQFSVMSGDDSLTFALMALGGHGVVSVVSNLIPREVLDLVRKLQQRDYTGARALHYKLMPLFRDLFIETNPIPIKAAMSLCGMAAGGCRLPLCDLTEESQRKLEETLQKSGLLTGACR